MYVIMFFLYTLLGSLIGLLFLPPFFLLLCFSHPALVFRRLMVCVVCVSVSVYVCVCMLLLLRDDGGRRLAGCGRRCRRGRLAGPFRLLLLDPLLDQIVGHVDGVGRPGDGDDAVPGARREDALLRDLDVGTGQVLDLDQTAPGGT